MSDETRGQRIADLRVKVADLTSQANDLKLRKEIALARAKAKILADAGGQKALGSNESTQNINLMARLDNDGYAQIWRVAYEEWYNVSSILESRKGELQAHLDLRREEEFKIREELAVRDLDLRLMERFDKLTHTSSDQRLSLEPDNVD